MPTQWTYRVQLQEVWKDGYAPDPSTFWLSRDETIQLLDDALGTVERDVSQRTYGMITVTPFLELLDVELPLDWRVEPEAF